MFSADSYVVEFVGKNWISLGLLIGFLKLLARRSKSTLDDSILSYLAEALSGFRRQKEPDAATTAAPTPPETEAKQTRFNLSLGK